MQPDDVRKLVEESIGDDWDETNLHGVSLRRALVQPPRKITVIDRTVSNGEVVDRNITVWLVLVEGPGPDEGYRIVMKENEPEFALAGEGFPQDKHLVVTWWTGGFMATFIGM